MAVMETVVVQDELHIWQGLKGAEEAKAWVDAHLGRRGRRLRGCWR